MLNINNTTRQTINLNKTAALGEKFLRAYKKSGYEVSLAVVGDTAMRRLNKQYRGIDRATDVLSFLAPATFDRPKRKGNRLSSEGKSRRPGTPPAKYLGEIVINIQEAKRTGKYAEMLKELALDRRYLTSDYLFYFLLVHGLLHLIGYEDATESTRREMLEIGREFLEKQK